MSIRIKGTGVDVYKSGYLEFKKSRDNLLQDGIDLLSARVGKVLTKESGLAEVLISTDPFEVSKRAAEPLKELEDMSRHDIMVEVQIKMRKTSLWLYDKGWMVFSNGRWTIDEVVWLECYREFWQTNMMEYPKGSEEAAIFAPTVGDWAVYLTIRGDIAPTFPSEGLYMYGIKRFVDIVELADNYDLPWALFITQPRSLEWLLEYLSEKSNEAKWSLNKLLR